MFQVVNCWLMSSAAATDPSFASTVLLLGFNGANGSVTVPDESAAARGDALINGATNDAEIQTANPKFGTGSLRLDGNGDRISFVDSADWNFGSGAFTIEGWFLFDAAAIEARQDLISQYSITTQRSWLLNYNGNLATNNLQFAFSTTGADTVSFSVNWTPTASQYYHIAVDRSGNVFRLYIDGAMVATTTNSGTLFNSTATLLVGASLNSTTVVNFFHGNVDEVRITKGVARYASDSGYVVPTAAFPRS